MVGPPASSLEAVDSKPPLRLTIKPSTEPLNGWIALLSYLFLGIGFPAYLQSGLNKVWTAQAGRAPAVPAETPATAPTE